MVSLRSGKVLEESNKQPTKPATLPRAPVSKKRKAEEAESTENEKENLTPAAAVEPTVSKNNATPPPPEPKEYERTPGRIGPIKKKDFSIEPNIKPFKGPPGKKVRKTFEEKEEEYAQFARENEGHCFHELHVCYAKGPNGSPTYDKSGFELDYQKVARWMNPSAYNKTAMVKGMDRAVNRAQNEQEQMAEIFYEKGEAPKGTEYFQAVGMWKDRVSKDLNVPWHKIGVAHFREWEKKGFKRVRKGEYLIVPIEQRERMTRLLSGASLRK
ncbi:uncharacterized protein LY89DRAFT_680024 [Mollisia scopiformis]|uniref:Uncharacterized protein n=1 Tax=Mollisia scopiformis TaxID=149040 RepID=A0A194XU54_MOLSC|nr:uncharacterized protein LY89DRAFT_680024 [Mollisia scopiformis]KUJ23237.1 hypothetical protein LY89DRAFT_680024 [Mollisia scopiformis]